MRNLFYKISSAMARFMYGRNGGDQLNGALFALYLAVWMLSVLLRKVPAAANLLDIFSVLLAVLVLFRTFSRNLSKRRAENAKFLNWWRPVKNRIDGRIRRIQDKEHKYFTCKSCKTICRVPAGKGKIEITCPKCGRKLIGKS